MDKDVQSPFAEKEKESISKLCEPSNEDQIKFALAMSNAFHKKLMLRF